MPKHKLWGKDANGKGTSLNSNQWPSVLYSYLVNLLTCDYDKVLFVNAKEFSGFYTAVKMNRNCFAFGDDPKIFSAAVELLHKKLFSIWTGSAHMVMVFLFVFLTLSQTEKDYSKRPGSYFVDDEAEETSAAQAKEEENLDEYVFDDFVVPDEEDEAQFPEQDQTEETEDDQEQEQELDEEESEEQEEEEEEVSDKKERKRSKKPVRFVLKEPILTDFEEKMESKRTTPQGICKLDIIYLFLFQILNLPEQNNWQPCRKGCSMRKV